MAKYEIKMTEGSVLKNHLGFALPLMATSVLQLFYSAADQVVVGRWTGSHALAAIGATSSLNLLIINFFVGLSVGAGIVISRKYGAGDMYDLNKTSHSAIAISFILGLMAMIVGIVFCRPLLVLMGTPKEVLNLSVLYMRILFAGAPFVMVYNFGSSILRAVGDTKRPLYILSVTGIVNVVLNLILVIIFHMGVAGVAIATITANGLSALAVLYVLCNSDAPYRIKLSRLKIFKDDFIDFLKIGIPAGMQSIMYNISNAVLQSSVNFLGTVTMAANTAVGSLEGFVYVATNSFYQSSLTAVGQNYGAGNSKRIYKVFAVGTLCSVVTGIVLGVGITVFSHQLLGIYITDSAEAIEIGTTRMFITTLPYFILSIMEQCSALLTGMGKAYVSAVNAFFGTCITRILWASLVFPKMPSLLVLYMIYPISWTFTTILHISAFLLMRKKLMGEIKVQ